jgi:hypothetical protein
LEGATHERRTYAPRLLRGHNQRLHGPKKAAAALKTLSPIKAGSTTPRHLNLTIDYSVVVLLSDSGMILSRVDLGLIKLPS